MTTRQFLLTVCLNILLVCPNSYGISNIFKNLAIFDWSPTTNETTGNTTKGEICVPPLLLHGIVDPVKNQYKSQDVIKIVCKDGYELENPQSSLLYCTQHGLWKVFTLGETVYIPLPRCLVKQKCPGLPPLMQGSMQVQEGVANGLSSELSSTRAVYQCWFGMELEPPESEIRYCVQGKWTGVNPTCVRTGCTRPPSIVRGFFASRGIVNHVYHPGSTVKYHCDPGYQLKGPAVLDCVGKEWSPKEVPTCTPLETSNSASSTNRGCPLPPPLLRGEYQILPSRRTFFPLSSAWSNVSSPMVPAYSSAVYGCHRGYVLRGGSAVISCTARGWWHPPYNALRCVPDGSLPSTSSSGGASRINLHRHQYNNGAAAGRGDDVDFDDRDQPEGRVPGPVLVSLTTAGGVIFVLSLIWIASRWKITCRRTGLYQQQPLTCEGVRPQPPPRRQYRSLWAWISHQQRSANSTQQLDDDDSLPAYDYQLEQVQQQQAEQDRVALMAYDTGSQATLPTYEEAVGVTATASWPLAPPSYESIAATSCSLRIENDEAVGADVTAADEEDDAGSRETLPLVPDAITTTTTTTAPDARR